jgi:2-C-methyl-D-erythritol 4-phosphate cytidylyltransferase
MNTVIILAGGRGSRMQAGINKAYLPLGDKPILAHTINIFNKHNLIDEIILVVGVGEESMCKSRILNKIDSSKVKIVVTGGLERQNSVYNGLVKLSDECKVVLIHDGARPFVSANIIKKCIEEAMIHGAVTAAVPVKETIKVVKNDNIIDHTPDRTELWTTQTPQGFKKEIILKAHMTAKSEDFIATDDAMLVESLGLQVRVVEGEYENIKITTPEDLAMAQAILVSKKK